MWDLNDSPDQRRGAGESEGSLSPVNGEIDKDKGLGSLSNSSSSAVVIEDGSDEEEDGGRGRLKKRSGTIFGFSVVRHRVADDNCSSESEPPVTRQFFPVESEMGASSGGRGGIDGGGGGANFPRAHWVGVKFCQSEAIGSFSGKAAEVSQPMKKSRRGPRSRSSQYRGVTFYRRTGRWESHIWSVQMRV